MHRFRVIPQLLLLAVIVVGCGGPKYDESLQMPNFNYGEVLDGHMRRAEQAMMSVRDLPSAEAAANQLHLINQDLDDVVYNAPRMSEDGQIALGVIAAQHLVEVQRLKADIDRNPTLARVFDVELETMMAYLQTMASGNFEDKPGG